MLRHSNDKTGRVPTTMLPPCHVLQERPCAVRVHHTLVVVVLQERNREQPPREHQPWAAKDKENRPRFEVLHVAAIIAIIIIIIITIISSSSRKGVSLRRMETTKASTSPSTS